MRTAEEFWAYVNKEGPVHPKLGTKCWLWTGYTHVRGYGRPYFRFADNSTERLAHRIAWRVTTLAPIPEEMCVLHRCDVRLCVNPEHLFLDTALKNTEDMRIKGRAAKGTQNSQTKLSESEVCEILTKSAHGQSQEKLACEYGCSRSAIQSIVSGKTWKHLRCSI